MKFLLLPLLAFASPEQILVKSQLFIGGKLMDSPSLIVNNGQEASISSGAKDSLMNLKLTPTKSRDGKILVSLRVEYLSGQHTVQSNQSIAMKQNEEVELSLGNDSSLKLTASER